MPIELTQSGDVVFLTINSPATRNGLDEVLCDQLITAVRQADAMSGARFLVLRGAEGWFCIGASGDFLSRAIEADRDTRVVFTEAAQGVVMEVLRCGLFTVGVLDGLAAGAGVDILLATDLTLATERARLGLLYSKLGLVPDTGFALLERRLRSGDALRLYAQSPTLRAQELRDLGLAGEAACDLCHDAELSRYLTETFRHNPSAYRQTKRLRNAPILARLSIDLPEAAAAQAMALDEPATQQRVLRSAGLQRSLT